MLQVWLTIGGKNIFEDSELSGSWSRFKSSVRQLDLKFSQEDVRQRKEFQNDKPQLTPPNVTSAFKVTRGQH